MIAVVCEPTGLLSDSELAPILQRVEAVAAEVVADGAIEFGEVTVGIVTIERIIALHAMFFDDPTPTDVITFPSAEYQPGELVEGDIVICLDVAQEQAGLEGHESQDEIVYLALHGLLHLCGWVDASDQDRQQMLAYQDEIMCRVRDKSSVH